MSGDGYSWFFSHYNHPPTEGPSPNSAQCSNEQYSSNLQQSWLASYLTMCSNEQYSSYQQQSWLVTNPTQSSNEQYSSNQQQSWLISNLTQSSNEQYSCKPYNTIYKRSYLGFSESEPQQKIIKKRKTSLPEIISNKKEWTMEEAEHALAVEQGHNKKSKNTLIIKFPDRELNKDIVSLFHSFIDDVHFVQARTPRFCFVTLQESANLEEVISVFNKQKFGDGYLWAELKKDREEEQTINAENLDPLTLYVGNLAQEITKEDMVNMYPNGKRIDIGFAKKMKFTRYAFVSFRTVDDSIKAFKNTHNKQMYNRSLIIRFRRLHATFPVSKPAQCSNNQGHDSGGQRNQTNYKRSCLNSSESEPRLKTIKKKLLSQNISNKKKWTLGEAEEALAVEKSHNKSNNSLIIKFPDKELNKDIVSQFHPSIENVYFQHPCTPRFCYVTLKEWANPEKAIRALNKQTFGDGYLSVDYKKGKEEDLVVNAEDLEPLTLYVGNLAQEITKEDMVNMYPNCNKINFGSGKKMKFTRCAFVSFRTVADSIEAFKNTYSKQLYNRSLIVRFRRLHGTTAMPGESSSRKPPKSIEGVPDCVTTTTDSLNH